MFDTISVFDVIAADETDARTASRRALALAHTRIDSRLGSFLGGAITQDEFDARLTAVKDDFDTYIKQACEEVGANNSEAISTSLIDHYSRNRRWQPRGPVTGSGKQGSPLGYPEPDPLDEHWDIDRPAFFDQQGQLANDPMRNQQGYIGPGVPQGVADRDEGFERAPGWVDPNLAPGQVSRRDYTSEGDRGLSIGPTMPPVWPGRNAPVRQGSKLASPWDQERGLDGTQGDYGDPYAEQPMCPTCGGPGNHLGTLGSRDHFRCRNCGMEFSQQQGSEYPYDFEQGPPSSDSGIPPEYGMRGAAYNPASQKDTAGRDTCPECGGRKKTANGSTCPKCKGEGDVAAYGDSVLDHVARVFEAEEHGNTDLGGPEPEINKLKWEPKNLDQNPSVEDSGRWPTKRKDPVEVIGPMGNRDQEGHDLVEIGEKTTETVDLPAAASNDTGFYDGGETKGPTSWQGGGKQADPVTNTSS